MKRLEILTTFFKVFNSELLDTYSFLQVLDLKGEQCLVEFNKYNYAL